MALYFAGICYIYKLLIKRFSISFTYKKIILFSIFWLIFEVIRSNLFTGFPWNLLGYVWLYNINFAQASSIFGIYGMSFFACLISVERNANCSNNLRVITWKNYQYLL